MVARDARLDGRAAEHVERTIADAGFTPLGWFRIEPDDALRDISLGRPAICAVLVGNAGPAMWQRFIAERASLETKIDDWSRDILADLARALGGRAHFPFDKPALPFQRWAYRSGRLHRSPLGMTIHPEYGLWHAYRAAFAFADTFPRPESPATTSPCDSCKDKPCLSTCPVSAFSAAGYDVPACAGHLSAPEGADCMALGCRARRACPVGRDYIYEPAQAEFHMTSFRIAVGGHTPDEDTHV